MRSLFRSLESFPPQAVPSMKQVAFKVKGRFGSLPYSRDDKNLFGRNIKIDGFVKSRKSVIIL
ncbi:MAG: hypothetical protein BWK74_04330 [Desulfobacteraceae bacterium A6]|nr:MAG: hypothetical protein BWK74_04330 [Desulfobacteraceae bacterium A6]